MPAYCEVALPVPLDRTFTYAVQEGQRPLKGARVIAPFRNEKLIGVVTGLSSKAPEDFEARYLEAVLDEEPLLSPELLELAAWMAGYYLAPLGEVLRGMLPLLAEVRRTVYYRITDLGRDVLANCVEGEPPSGSSSSAGDQAQAYRDRPAEQLGFSAGAKAPDDLAPFRARLKSCPDTKQNSSAGKAPSSRRRGRLSPEEQDMERRVLERLADGEAVKVSTLRTATAAALPVLAGMLRKKWIARETAAVERDARRMERFAVLIPEARLPKLTEKQQAILAELAACDGELPLTVLREKDLPSSTLQTLVRRGLVRIEERAAAFHLGGLQPDGEEYRLNEPQMEALASLVPALGRFKPFLLHGVTGSGRHAEGAGHGALVHSAGAGDRVDAADGGIAGRGLWEEGGAAALRVDAGRAQRSVAADQERGGSHRGGDAVGHFCACRQPGADPGGRGARPELQAGGDTAL
jgi:primosomal protein N' (replication factor Y)